jgi:hypothetical protein
MAKKLTAKTYLLQALAVGLVTIILNACGVLWGERTVPAVIELDERSGVEIEAPEVVTQGQEFQIEIQTYAGGCIEKGTTEVEIRDLEVEIRPYNVKKVQNTCRSSIRFLYHTATLMFEKPGDVTITIYGHSELSNQTKTVVRNVTVQP